MPSHPSHPCSTMVHYSANAMLMVASTITSATALVDSVNASQMLLDANVPDVNQNTLVFRNVNNVTALQLPLVTSRQESVSAPHSLPEHQKTPALSASWTPLVTMQSLGARSVTAWWRARWATTCPAVWSQDSATARIMLRAVAVTIVRMDPMLILIVSHAIVTSEGLRRGFATRYTSQYTRYP